MSSTVQQSQEKILLISEINKKAKDQEKKLETCF
jgi:hypothetical protein